MNQINFFEEDCSFSLGSSQDVCQWIIKVVKNENHSIEELNFIFCSDNYLIQINREYLNHDFYTDIITFDNSSNQGQIQSDIFISIDRIKENSNQLGTPFTDELHRVMIHGVLHLLGYKDKTNFEKEEMRSKEDACLSLRN